jgi:hypothetical protein
MTPPGVVSGLRATLTEGAVGAGALVGVTEAGVGLGAGLSPPQPPATNATVRSRIATLSKTGLLIWAMNNLARVSAKRKPPADRWLQISDGFPTGYLV